MIIIINITILLFYTVIFTCYFRRKIQLTKLENEIKRNYLELHYKIHKRIHEERIMASVSYTDVLDNVIRKSPHQEISLLFASLTKEEVERLIVLLQNKYSLKKLICKEKMNVDTMFYRLEKDLFVFLDRKGYREEFDREAVDRTKNLKEEMRRIHGR